MDADGRGRGRVSARERPFTVPPDTVRNQRAASDPRASAWVAANAGSGKTFVLTQRVLRLLLDGAAPGSILCLTYTKAAAAEMRHRVSVELGRWARMDDAALAEVLFDLTGTRAEPDDLARARTLFAHALETPGGLKILTIHAFCEAVLQRFPREAGVPVDFTVIEDDAKAGALKAAREAVLAEGLAGHPEVADAVAYLFTHLSDTQIESGISESLIATRQLEAVLADVAGAKARSARLLGVRPGESEESLLAEALGATLVPFADHPRVFAVCPPDPDKSRFEDHLARIDRDVPTLEHLFAAYLKKDGTVPARLFRAELRKAEPELAERLEAEAHRLAALHERRKAIRLATRSAALIDVLNGIALRYEADKRARSQLDFDDLVTRAAALFANPDYGAWVRYKLDAGIDHILVDEGQDTNAQQWAVIEALSAEFFAGEGVGRPKTLFGVGDPKQSIYSFQGAEPELFIAKGREYGTRARQADVPFRDLTLRTSFRTLPEILDGVDRVCARPDIAAALLAGDTPPNHESARRGQGGTIAVLAPYAEPAPLAPGADWPLEPLPASPSATRQLAARIANTIGGWIDRGAPLAQRARAIRPEDILILVQSRGPLFSEIVLALKQRGIASPGADRLPVTGHIAVKDLLGLADVLANPEDDLLLAAVLRSPLYGLSEDALYALAGERAKGESVWAALGRASDPPAKAAHAELFALRSRLDFDRPYGLFAHVLYRLGGLRRFHARLGTEVDDVLAEFLDLALEHETSDQPSLTGFLARMRASEVTIKRDLAERGGGVRVMTVHGAKGLEAPIVFLADATAAPPPLKQCVFFGETDGWPVLVFSGGSDNDTAASGALRDAARARQDAEYWRKLYVAMTRAEDRLIVAGTTSLRKTGKGSWFEAITTALGSAGEGEDAGEAVEPGAVMLTHPAAPLAPAPVQRDAAGHAPPETVPLILEGAPASPSEREIVSPSLLDGLSDAGLLAPAGEVLLDADSARLRGLALHALLQHLGKVPEGSRQTVAHSAAGNLLAERPALAASVADQALAILSDARFAHVFGPDSRAEVSFALDGTRNETPIRLVGRIDRLVVSAERVSVVDFKSDALPPGDPAQVPPAYAAQLALYRRVAQRLFPGRPVGAAILWTESRALMPLADEMLDRLAAPYRL